MRMRLQENGVNCVICLLIVFSVTLPEDWRTVVNSPLNEGKG